MGVENIRWVSTLRGLTPAERLTMICLADCAKDKTRACWPSLKYIAGYTELRIPTISKVIKKMSARGLVEVSGRQTHTYKLLISDKLRSRPPVNPTLTGVNLRTTPLYEPERTKNYSASALPGLAGISLSNGQMSNGALNGKSVHARPPDDPDSDLGFREFWAAYPRKVGKWAAWKAWRKLKITAELKATILAAVEAHKESDSWTKDDGKFIPHPGTWLNNRRWEDEMQEANNGFDWRY